MGRAWGYLQRARCGRHGEAGGQYVAWGEVHNGGMVAAY